MNSTVGIISLCLSCITAIAQVMFWFGYLKSRVETMGVTNEEIRKDLKESTAELRTVIVTVRAFADTQKVINEFTQDTLKAIIHRLDLIENRLNGYARINNKE